MRILITGGTGSLGRALLRHYRADPRVTWLGVYSRDEVKQARLRAEWPEVERLLGDVRDARRLEQAMGAHPDLVIHAAALKRVESVAANPWEAVSVNVLGTQAVLEAAIRADVPRVVLISSDKAVEPWNLYGVTKAAAEHLTIQANRYAALGRTRACVVRYGNVMGSRGSVIETWRQAIMDGTPLELTDPRMTRFWLSLEDAVHLVDRCAWTFLGGEVFVPMLPSVRMVDVAEAVAGPDYAVTLTGLRDGGEKLAERLLTHEEVGRTLGDLERVVYLVQPAYRSWSSVPYPGQPVDPNLNYTSDCNAWTLSVEEIRTWLSLST